MAYITSNDTTINGTARYDYIKGGERKQTINGGGGDDQIEGNGGFDTLNGNAGNDALIGVGWFYGGSGDDFMFGQNYTSADLLYRDHMNGGSGNDTMLEFNRNVDMDGGSGNDYFGIGDGIDFTLKTGSGNDYAEIGRSDGTITVNGSGYKSLFVGGGDHILNISHGDVYALLSYEIVQYGNYDWSYQQVAGDNKVTIGAQAGQASISTGNGDDVFNVAASNTNSNALFGGGGDDTMTGGNGGEYLSGDAGDDIINGRGGNDTIVGGVGNNTLKGGDGNDYIGVHGGDTAWGGNDADRFVVSGDGWGARTIVLKDFRASQGDVLDVSSLYAFNDAMATFNNGRLAFATDNGLITIEGSGIRNGEQFLAAKQNGSIVTDMDYNGGKG